MHTKFMSSKFARLYLWFAKAKYTMGIFYAAYVFIFLLLGLASEGPSITLDLYTAIEMLFACFIIGIIQQAMLTVDKLNRTRCVLWVVSGTLVTLVFSLAFDWFQHLPIWCFAVFHICIALGMAAMILLYYIELHRETKLLNQQLEQFQRDKKEV